jgi:hypothetical protein
MPYNNWKIIIIRWLNDTDFDENLIFGEHGAGIYQADLICCISSMA